MTIEEECIKSLLHYTSADSNSLDLQVVYVGPSLNGMIISFFVTVLG